jgi:hypothetical protein
MALLAIFTARNRSVENYQASLLMVLLLIKHDPCSFGRKELVVMDHVDLGPLM